MIIRIGMQCGYEGSWAQPLAIASVLQGDGYSWRGAAPTGGRVVCWAGVGAPPRGEAVEAGSILVGQPLFAAGRRSYRGRVVCWIDVGAPPRGEVFPKTTLV